MPDTHPLSGLEDLRLVTLQNPRPAVPSRRDADVAGNTSDVNVDQQLLGGSVGGDILPDIPVPNISFPDVPLPEVHPDGSVGEE